MGARFLRIAALRRTTAHDVMHRSHAFRRVALRDSIVNVDEGMRVSSAA